MPTRTRSRTSWRARWACSSAIACGVPHAFWNPGDAPARLLELISPAGFERYFEEAAALYASGSRDTELAAELRRQYRLEMDLGSIPRLLQAHGLRGS